MYRVHLFEYSYMSTLMVGQLNPLKHVYFQISLATYVHYQFQCRKFSPAKCFEYIVSDTPWLCQWYKNHNQCNTNIRKNLVLLASVCGLGDAQYINMGTGGLAGEIYTLFVSHLSRY